MSKGKYFEASIRAALKQSPEVLEGAGKIAPFDFNPYKLADKDLLNLFGDDFKGLQRIEAKIKQKAAHNIVSKYVNEFIGDGKSKQVDAGIKTLVATINAQYGLTAKGSLSKAKKTTAKGRVAAGKGKPPKAAMGFVPNFVMGTGAADPGGPAGFFPRGNPQNILDAVEASREKSLDQEGKPSRKAVQKQYAESGPKWMEQFRTGRKANRLEGV